MRHVRLYSYRPGSDSGKQLAEALGIKRIKHKRSSYRPNRKSVLINWGSSSRLPPQFDVIESVYNKPDIVAICANKLRFFEWLESHGLEGLEHTTSRKVAESWLNEGISVVCRTVLNGHSGDGIVIVDRIDSLVNAPLYTKYFKKKHEYRVHFAFGKIIDSQRKMRVRDVPDAEVNWKVRNLAGGFVYGREGVDLPDEVEFVCQTFIDTSPLDFGAIDVLYNEKNNEAVICEVNTAPGLAGTTLEKYTEAFKEVLQ